MAATGVVSAKDQATPIELQEYQSREYQLTVEEAQALAHIVVPGTPGKSSERRRMLSVSPGSRSGLYKVTADSIVGSVFVGLRPVYVRPKVGAARTLFMASYAQNRVSWWETEGLFEKDSDFHDLLPRLLLREIEEVVKSGLLEDYVNVEETAPYVRGRIRFAEQIRSQRGLPLPVALEYQEFSTDIPENQLLKAGLTKTMVLSSKFSAQCRTLLSAFDGVQGYEFDPLQLPAIALTRRNERYRSALGLARLVIQNAGAESAALGIRSAGITFDLDTVFEDFIFRVLSDELRSQRGLTLISNATGKNFRLDQSDRVGLEPDLSIWDGPDCVFIGDVKHKDLDKKGVSNGDLYQLTSYATAAGVAAAMLIFPGKSDSGSYEVRNSDIKITVVTVDVLQDPEAVLDGVRRVAADIGRSVDEARGRRAVHALA